MKKVDEENTFFLFRAPGEPGYIAGAMTSAGRYAPARTGNEKWNIAIDAAAASVIQQLGLIWLQNGELLGECGLLLPNDYLEQIDEAANAASDAYCRGH
jgi:hypothetical protein